MSTEVIPKGEALSREQINLIKRTVAKGCDDDELELFLYTAKRLRLDPLARQIHAVKRWDSQAQREVMAIQTGIDGYRLIAERTGNYLGQDGPYWCGEDGAWHDVWLKKEPPAAAKVGVLRRGFEKPVWGIARFDSYAGRKKDGTLTAMWLTKADLMIAKCAEAIALKKAFPHELSPLLTEEEMGTDQHIKQADVSPTVSPESKWHGVEIVDVKETVKQGKKVFEIELDSKQIVRTLDEGLADVAAHTEGKVTIAVRPGRQKDSWVYLGIEPTQNETQDALQLNAE